MQYKCWPVKYQAGILLLADSDMYQNSYMFQFFLIAIIPRIQYLFRTQSRS